jgi:K+:H+ antiporter
VSAVGSGAEEITLRLLYQLIVILVATRLVTALVRRLGQTDVSGEILAGVLLGPSMLGALFPGFMAELFPVSTGAIFTGIAQVGLIFLMFQIGLEFEFHRHLGGNRRAIVLISVLSLRRCRCSLADESASRRGSRDRSVPGSPPSAEY